MASRNSFLDLLLAGQGVRPHHAPMHVLVDVLEEILGFARGQCGKNRSHLIFREGHVSIVAWKRSL